MALSEKEYREFTAVVWNRGGQMHKILGARQNLLVSGFLHGGQQNKANKGCRVITTLILNLRASRFNGQNYAVAIE
jgi:hypothetical protein